MGQICGGGFLLDAERVEWRKQKTEKRTEFYARN